MDAYFKKKYNNVCMIMLFKCHYEYSLTASELAYSNTFSQNKYDLWSHFIYSYCYRAIYFYVYYVQLKRETTILSLTCFLELQYEI